MKIKGKKIVELGENEKKILEEAAGVLFEIHEEIGSEDYYDFEDLGTILDSIRFHGPFEIDFEDPD